MMPICMIMGVFVCFCRKKAGITSEMPGNRRKMISIAYFLNFLSRFELGFGTSFELDESPIKKHN